MKEILAVQLERLKQKYNGARLEERADGTALISVPNVPLSAGWDRKHTTVRFVLPAGYPLAQPDCFWTDAELRLANGTLPQNAAINNSHGGTEPLLWFSWHLANWDPNASDLLRYVRAIESRLRRAQ